MCDLALRQIHAAHQSLVAVAGELVVLRQKGSRAVAQAAWSAGSQKVSGWESWKTLMLVWAYHSFDGEVEASNTPAICHLILHAVTSFRA
jgi:hypothetical protein